MWPKAMPPAKMPMMNYENSAKPNSKAPLGQGGRFAALKNKLASKGAKNPAALAAYIGRKKLGKAKFQKLAAKGKK